MSFNPVKFIQKNVLGDASAVITRKLTEIQTAVLKEVYDYHDWKCLLRQSTLGLEKDVPEYNLSGANQDLGKIVAIYYGDDLDPLDSYEEEKEFNRSVYGRISGDDPVAFLTLRRPNEHTWRIKIHPCGMDSVTVPYSYKKLSDPSDINLYSNPMVFVHGILTNFYGGSKKAANIRLSERRLAQYFATLEKMKEQDEATIHPKGKIVISDQRRRDLRMMRTMDNRRSR